MLEKTIDNSNFFEEKKCDDIDNFFDEYLKSTPIFKDKSVLSPNHKPEKIEYREDYLKKIAQILAPVLKDEKPSNLFIYGKTGTGKSLCVNHIVKKIEDISKSKEDSNIIFIRINCKLKKVADTEYRMLLEILNFFGIELPSTGISTNELYKNFLKVASCGEKNIILVLDEIDHLIKKVGDSILYNLVRINDELNNSKLSIIGITNDLTIMDGVDARVKSSLGEEEIVFLPYNAVEIQGILSNRCESAFYENTVDEDVIPQISSFCAKEHGDARRALELFRFSGELAQRENSGKIKVSHVIKADKKTEKNKIIYIIKSQPKQFQIVLYSILKTSFRQKINLVTQKKTCDFEPTTTGLVYDYYNKISEKIKQSVVSLRRVSDIIVELEVLGIVNFKIVSKGRYGRTKYITIGLPKSLYGEVNGILKEDLGVF